MGGEGFAPGSAGLQLAAGVGLSRPEEQVFTAMLDGWRNQQLARNLAFSTINGREKTVTAFAGHADAFPWRWTPMMVDEWLGDLRAVRHLKRSTLRAYQEAVRSFCHYITDPAYTWPSVCEQRFGTHPIQVVHEWNTAVHVQDAEADPGKRALTLSELEALFDHADVQVARVRTAGRRAGCRRSATPPCSRSLTDTGYGATRSGCSTRSTSGATRTGPNMATTGWSTSVTARPRRARRRNGAAC